MEVIQRRSDDLGYFNMARGLGMLAVVAGHSISPFLAPADSAPELFGRAGSVFGGGLMAMFFLISGFGFYRRSSRKCLLIQTKLLLFPYAIVAAAVLLTKLGLAIVERRSFWAHGGEYILTYLLGLNAEGGGRLWGFSVESVSIFWFVLALFGSWVIYNQIVQCRSRTVQWVLVGGCVVGGYLLTLISRIWPFCIPMALLAVGYLAVGALVRKHQLLERKLPVWTYVLVCVPVLLSAAFGEVNIVACVWRLGLIDVASTFCLGFLLLRLAHVPGDCEVQ
ncbi:MAG: acyltransferase family protein, partial [Peptococcaceae bacterium]